MWISQQILNTVLCSCILNYMCTLGARRREKTRPIVSRSTWQTASLFPGFYNKTYLQSQQNEEGCGVAGSGMTCNRWVMFMNSDWERWWSREGRIDREGDRKIKWPEWWRWNGSMGMVIYIVYILYNYPDTISLPFLDKKIYTSHGGK